MQPRKHNWKEVPAENLKRINNMNEKIPTVIKTTCELL